MSDSFVTPWTVAHHVHQVPWDFSGKNTGVGCHFLFQSIFPTHGLKCASCIAGRWEALVNEDISEKIIQKGSMKK